MADEVIIGGVSLDTPMFWEEEQEWATAVGSAGRALEGNALYQSYPIAFDQPMTLVGSDNKGWQKKSTVESLRALASEVGATYTLTYWGTDYQVRFAHEETKHISFAPVTTVDDPDADFWYTGTIRLMIVS